MNAEAKIVLAKTGRGTESKEWVAAKGAVIVGKDVLELLSSSMYVDPMSIYREYVQNAADAIDQFASIAKSRAMGSVHVTVDANERRIVIRDNGSGVPAQEFSQRLINLGASTKRGTTARGFRGVGRLAGLGYCQELIFRSQADGESTISEMRWDCRRLRALLRAAEHDKDIVSVVRDVVSTRNVPASKARDRFFEVELSGVVRHSNDRLLSADAVRDYLAQVAPVPFSPGFTAGAEISAALTAHKIPPAIEIRVNDSEQPIYRPHRDRHELEVASSPICLASIEFHELPAIDGDIGAIAWIAHHDYAGAIPNSASIKGLRIRSGNIQVGDHNLFEDLFSETRFNSWSVGEVHVLDGKLIPNGRRDHFEQSVHFENLQNQLAPVVREIAKRCRHSSVSRKWVKTFSLHKQNALERAKVVARGGISRSAAHLQANAAKTALKAMHRVVEQKYLTDELRTELAAEAAKVDARVSKMILGTEAERNPLKHFRPPVRRAYEQVITMIYDCMASRSAAGVLVEKILNRLEADAAKVRKPRRAR